LDLTSFSISVKRSMATEASSFPRPKGALDAYFIVTGIFVGVGLFNVAAICS
jgi:hypothetical protein